MPRSAAFKPFMTEYRVSYKDPTPTKGKYSGKSKIKALTSPTHHEHEKKPGDLTLPPLPSQHRPMTVATSVAPFQSTSLTLPGMVNGGNSNEKRQTRRRRILEASAPISGTPMRYNIITGVAIDGEPSSGFKEGRRAFVRTFAHFDAVTNARTPGYNIITGHDAVGRMPQQPVIPPVQASNQRPMTSAVPSH
ncbi:hypothetical protein HK105_201569 [Polyrhizophydium stewartii]|uniref:Uncharacterized protein n=1 Tax=Polyrhizophydium stewartii TaxID=2732419 RepID=A0ABR4NGZ8_9FUNG